MRSKRRSKVEQMELVLKCRQSGLSDYAWCTQNDINPGTFGNWVQRLRKSGYVIPDTLPAGEMQVASQQQEVVKLDLFSDISVARENTCIPSNSFARENTRIEANEPVLELSVGEVNLRVSNDIKPELLRITLQCLGGNVYAR